jgi:hypothetical protein
MTQASFAGGMAFSGRDFLAGLIERGGVYVDPKAGKNFIAQRDRFVFLFHNWAQSFIFTFIFISRTHCYNNKLAT